jgi:RNA polymerase sigma-70 factor (ECF subfamily)
MKLSPMMDEDLDVLAQAREGSSSAFSTLVRRHQARVRSYLGAWLRRPDIVDDVAQETFLDAYRRLHSYRGEAPFVRWLLGVARNCGLRHLQEAARRRGAAALDALSALSSLMEERMRSEEITEHDRKVAALEACLDHLPDHGARLVSEVYFHRRPAAAVARDSGRSESAVWMMLLRLRKSLRACIESRLEGSEPA